MEMILKKIESFAFGIVLGLTLVALAQKLFELALLLLMLVPLFYYNRTKITSYLTKWLEGDKHED
jgi:hypothetical protein